MYCPADVEKRRAAASSVVAAVALTGLKIVVGLMTGSLGILAEAAHSGLDLAAAIMTWFAVRISGKPADETHTYGHGKVENLSALLETFLLVVTCVWILWHAGSRLISGALEIEVTFWSFAVMATSIVVDYTRSTILYRAARKYNSLALEADALHFRTDIWSSAVVIAGLGLVKASEIWPALAWLKSADAVAAIIVAVIVLVVCFELSMRALHGLLDAAPPGVESAIAAAAESVPGVVNCHAIRARRAGSQLFVDAHVLVDGLQSLEQAHEVTDAVEESIRRALPGADVTVHAEPAPGPRAEDAAIWP